MIPIGAKLRVARPTDQLEACVAFYKDALGLDELGAFADHDGFDGVMLGHPDQPWHLELTRKAGHEAGRAPSPEHLLVLYIPDPNAFDAAVARVRSHGHEPVRAFNPYWDRAGVTFEDPDGYRVVLCNSDWPPTD